MTDDGSAYLSLPLRSLREVYDEVAAQVLDLEQRQSIACDEEYDRLGDELGPLLNRMEVLEEELGWRDRADGRR